MTIKGREVSGWTVVSIAANLVLAGLLALAGRGYEAPAAMNQERIAALSRRVDAVEASSQKLGEALQTQTLQLAVLQTEVQAVKQGVGELLKRHTGR